MANWKSPLLWLSATFLVFVAGVAASGIYLYRISGDSETMAAVASVVAFTLGLACAAVLVGWQIVFFGVIKPARRLAVEVRAIVNGGDREQIDLRRYGTLPALPEAVNELAANLALARRQRSDAVDAATAQSEKEKARLAAILNDLHEGVVLCNLKNQVVLYNQVALGMLGVSGEMGLGRALSGLLVIEPVLHNLDILRHRPQGAPDNAPFVTSTPDGRRLLQGRMSLVRAQEQVSGYVITFNDVTDSVAALARRDAMLRETIDGLRDPVERMEGPDADAPAAMTEVKATFLRASRDYKSLLAGWWPMTDVNSAYLFNFVIRRLDDSGLKLTMTGLPLWLHGDSHSLILALEALIRRIAKGTGATEFDLSAEAESGHGWIGITWHGTRVDDETLIDWQRAKVSPALGGMTVRDVMVHHTREDLVEEASGGQVSLRIALYLGREGHDRAEPSDKLPPRPEFFDLNLLAQAPAGDLGQVALRDLTFVVFDTETTGLSPTQGDRIVSIAGVRIVNGRILTGETFNRIVNPGRWIPKESVRFHGITDDMVVDKPPITVVLPQFKAFVADAVLVAHNAAFDLKFIRMREAESGVSFGNTVLDTMLLSSFVDGTTDNQNLDAIAERYGIPVTDRHTALGDSLATAVVLLRLISALEAKGIRTLDEALEAVNMTMELHNRVQALI
ncbi:MAG TPA: PAS domain-containing protein [Rhodospirillaceae bacterium]|nr:PAS domain-containing protein [Rhodospirillaceae bacterium]